MSYLQAQSTTTEMTTTTTTTRDLSTTRKMVCHFAHQIMRLEFWDRSEAMKMAWEYIRSKPDAYLVTFEKVSKRSRGEITTRIVSRNWTNYQEPKGGRSNTKPGQVIVADLAKHFTQQSNCVISYYQEKVLRAA